MAKDPEIEKEVEVAKDSTAENATPDQTMAEPAGDTTAANPVPEPQPEAQPVETPAPVEDKKPFVDYINNRPAEQPKAEPHHTYAEIKTILSQFNFKHNTNMELKGHFLIGWDNFPLLAQVVKELTDWYPLLIIVEGANGAIQLALRIKDNE